MDMKQGYREYNTWLQRGSSASMPQTAIQVPAGAGFIRKECRLGLVRLFGEGIVQANAQFTINCRFEEAISAEGYVITGSGDGIDIAALDTRGLLYGMYAMLARLRLGDDPRTLSLSSVPRVERRAINHWDNITGRIERGYSGCSLFFRDGTIEYDTQRVQDYARMLASMGINEVCLNNVNVTPESAKLITPELLPKLSALAAVFRAFHIRLLIAVHFESPVLLGGLPTADPVDAAVAAWWRKAVATVYAAIPDLAGFLMKADSEFRDGPASFGRTQADGANVIARALRPFGGIVYWRCFVYNCKQDWRDMQTDRPMAAYEHFQPLDGKFENNVILQIKNGPSDFQVREPNSPLLGAMPSTRQALELQITQEYTGQQIDLYALAVQWQEILDATVDGAKETREFVGPDRNIQAFAAVANVGDNENWTGHTLAQANLYAYGRMAWDPDLTAEAVLREWIGLTFGTAPELVNPLLAMMLQSRDTFEKYNAPLGIGWMVNVGSHYGPSVDGYEYMGWGTYHRADHRAIGVDRTPKGTGFTRQYHPSVAAQYEDLSTCPMELLLFFHRLQYDYLLPTGVSVLQHIYDTHFEGVREVEGFQATWQALETYLPPQAFASVYERFMRQLENAREWRDVINTYFYRKTGIPDQHGRLIYP